MSNLDYSIDFVLPWVDDSDPSWKKEKEHYWKQSAKDNNQDGNSKARFRDWNNLQYWFRGIEKFTPWVNKVFFVTWGHVPKWLNINHPKIRIIKHEDYIPKKYLPVFSANPIEINFHRIKELSEHFVYLNDDMFIINHMSKDDFFHNGLPREMAVRYPLYTHRENETFQHMLFTMTGIINSCFDVPKAIRANRAKWYSLKYGKYLPNNILMSHFPFISGLMTPHVPSSLRKTTMEEVWRQLDKELSETSSHRFREMNDITQYIFRYWEMLKGTFEPTNILNYSGEFFCHKAGNELLYDAIKKQRYKMICINDNFQEEDMDSVMKEVINAFESILPEKSTFEK